MYVGVQTANHQLAVTICRRPFASPDGPHVFLHSSVTNQGGRGGRRRVVLLREERPRTARPRGRRVEVITGEGKQGLKGRSFLQYIYIAVRDQGGVGGGGGITPVFQRDFFRTPE